MQPKVEAKAKANNYKGRDQERGLQATAKQEVQMPEEEALPKTGAPDADHLLTSTASCNRATSKLP